MHQLINKHFYIYLHQENNFLCKQLSCEMDTLENVKNELSQLNPYSLRAIYDKKELSILPNGIVEYNEGTLKIRLT